MAVAKFTMFVDIHILKYVDEISWVEFPKFDWNIRTNMFPIHRSSVIDTVMNHSDGLSCFINSVTPFGF